MYVQVFGSSFEADTQRSHLVRLRFADATGTSDSDLLTFVCPLTLYGHVSTSKKSDVMVRPVQTCCTQINIMTVKEYTTVSLKTVGV